MADDETIRKFLRLVERDTVHYYDALAALYRMATRIAQLEQALTDVLKYGEHDGPCDNENDSEERPCELHLQAAVMRRDRAQMVLTSLR